MNNFFASSSSSVRVFRRAILCVAAMFVLSAFPARSMAAESGTAEKAKTEQVEGAKPAAAEEKKEEALPAYAVPLYYGIGGHPGPTDAEGHLIGRPKFGPFAVTNSMLVTWIVAILIILFARGATRNIKQVPEGAQNFWEWLVEALRNFLEGIIGRDLTKMTFWFFATIFIFILTTNWFGLLPGVGTIGWGHPDEHGELNHIAEPLLRGANADLNMTLAMSMIFFLCWIVWAIRANGFGGFLLHLFGPKGQTKGFMKAVMIVVFAIVGVLEVVSILFRPISLSFRLYGNIFAGENVLEAMAHVYPPLAPIIPIPFYFMELLVGFAQALVFMLLTAVFTLLICTHEDESHH